MSISKNDIRAADSSSFASECEKPEKDSIKDNKQEEIETHWPSIYLLTAICMFTGIQFSIFFPTLWPFLNTVDPSASETFFGYIAAAYSIGQAIASPAFGFWMNKTKSIKQPLVFGTVIMIVSNVIFCFVEAFKEKDRRWVMMAARFFIGVGAGVVGIMRAYAATASSLKDRAKAITFVQASFVIGMTIGPAIQLAFTPIGYPGITLNSFHLDMYTAPAWFASLINLFSLVFIFIFLEENYVGVTEVDEDENPFFAMPKFDVIAIGVCVYTQFALMFIIANLDTADSMYAKTMWGWTNEEAVTNLAIVQGISGAVSVLIYSTFTGAFGKFVSNGKERIFTIIGLSLGVFFHLITFPWPFLEQHIPESGIYVNKKNISEEIGCDRGEFPWCSSTKQVNFWVYAVSYDTVLAACFPMVNIPMNTLFSKILGGRRQGTMQGIVLMAGSTARTIGPLIVSWLFENKGPIPLWYTEIGVLSVSILSWLIFYRRLVPLDPNPQLKPFEYYEYDRGRLYRI